MILKLFVKFPKPICHCSINHLSSNFIYIVTVQVANHKFEKVITEIQSYMLKCYFDKFSHGLKSILKYEININDNMTYKMFIQFLYKSILHIVK